MKFTSISLLALGLSGALATPAQPIEKRAGGVQSILQVFSTISNKVDALNSAIQSYNGGDPSKVESASQAVVSATKSGIPTAKNAGQLSQSDALQLTKPVQGLIKQTKNVVSELDSKEAKFAAAGACQKVLSSLKDQKSTSSELSKAINSNVPKSLQSISAKLSSQIADAIQKGIDAYQNCHNTGGSGGGSGGNTATAAASGSSMTATMNPSTATAGGSMASSSATGSSGMMPTGSGSAPSSTPSVVHGVASRGHISYGLGTFAAVVAMML